MRPPTSRAPTAGPPAGSPAWSAGRTFILPFLFVLTPSLLMDGPAHLIVWNFCRILFGLFVGTAGDRRLRAAAAVAAGAHRSTARWRCRSCCRRRSSPAGTTSTSPASRPAWRCWWSTTCAARRAGRPPPRGRKRLRLRPTLRGGSQRFALRYAQACRVWQKRPTGSADRSPTACAFAHAAAERRTGMRGQIAPRQVVKSEDDFGHPTARRLMSRCPRARCRAPPARAGRRSRTAPTPWRRVWA